jgi:hypothetical protein
VSDVAYVSKVRIERKVGPLRVAHLPDESQEVIFSVHGAIAEHYKVDPAKLKESHASTIDYVIAATAGWMLGTFGGALEARHIDASNGKLVGEVTGEVETEEGVLVIRRIHVTMRLVAPEQDRGTVERVHALYAMRCHCIGHCTTRSSSRRHSRWKAKRLDSGNRVLPLVGLGLSSLLSGDLNWISPMPD